MESIGQFEFIWVATMDDSTVVSQLDSSGNPIAISAIDLSHCIDLAIVPRPGMRRRPGIPFDLPTVRVKPELAKGELAFWHWLVDIDATTGDKLYRHVLGIQLADGTKVSTVTLFKNGEVTLCTNEDLAAAPDVW